MTEDNRSREPGAPVSAGFVALCVPEMTGREWDYVKECFDTNWVSSAGPYVDRFEQQIASYVGAQHGVATSSGTAALHLALLVAGVEPDDEVLVSTLTFIAPTNAIRYASAWPVLVDADPVYGQMDADRVQQFLENDCSWDGSSLVNKATKRRVKALLPVHILGHPVEMDPLMAVARRFELVVIEDATESLGARYKDSMVGHIGDVSCFSFNGNKLLTTGGGGLLVTDQQDWAAKARYLSTQAKDDPIEYVHNEIGFNYRMTNVQAAMGCAQLESIEPYLASKRRIYERYVEAFAEVPGLAMLPEAEWAHSACWMATVLVDAETFGMDSRELLRHLDREKIQARPLWQPMHQSMAHAGSPAVGGEVAERFVAVALSIPCSVGLTEANQERVIAAMAAAQR